MKKYKFYWKDGHIDECEGFSPADALLKLGYGAGALPAMDHWEEIFASIDIPNKEDRIIVTYRGKPIDEMSREELLQALTDAYFEMDRMRKSHTRDLEFLSELHRH